MLAPLQGQLQNDMFTMEQKLYKGTNRRQQKHDMLLEFTANMQMKPRVVRQRKAFIFLPHLLLLAIFNIGYRQLDFFNKYYHHFFNR